MPAFGVKRTCGLFLRIQAVKNEAGLQCHGLRPAFWRKLPDMHYVDLMRVLVLLALANGSPVIAARIFGRTLARPLDGNAKFVDGRPLFGASKTVRGIIVALAVTALGAPLLGLEFQVGLLVGASAMAGDLFSSFLKRRLGLPPSSRATGLDQIPESLFPLLACSSVLPLSLMDIAAGCAIFFVGELLLSNLFFRLHLRDRPY
jgi:CDP-archaeol synthase